MIFLRPVEPSDLDFLYRWENDPSVLRFSDCSEAPYSRETLRQFIDNQQLGFEANGQLRLMICLTEQGGAHRSVGMLDLFDHDHLERSAGVGILICDPADRRQGYAREALSLALDYARQTLGLQRLTAVISTDNASSLALFRAVGFEPQQPSGLPSQSGQSDPAARKKTGVHPTGELLFEKQI